jgi:hypothetical protein
VSFHPPRHAALCRAQHSFALCTPAPLAGVPASTARVYQLVPAGHRLLCPLAAIQNCRCRGSNVVRIEGTIRGRARLAKSFADAGLADFLRMLRYKPEWAGREWRTVAAFTRSTGVCRDCDLTGERLPPAAREWRCTGCGAVHDRDVAAARTVLIRAERGNRHRPAKASLCRAWRGWSASFDLVAAGKLRMSRRHRDLWQSNSSVRG